MHFNKLRDVRQQFDRSLNRRSSDDWHSARANDSPVLERGTAFASSSACLAFAFPPASLAPPSPLVCLMSTFFSVCVASLPPSLCRILLSFSLLFFFFPFDSFCEWVTSCAFLTPTIMLGSHMTRCLVSCVYDVGMWMVRSCGNRERSVKPASSRRGVVDWLPTYRR